MGACALAAALASRQQFKISSTTGRHKACFFSTRNWVEPPKNIAIVAIDDLTLLHLQKNFIPQILKAKFYLEPLPFSVYCIRAVIERLMAAGARSVAGYLLTPVAMEGDDQSLAMLSYAVSYF